MTTRLRVLAILICAILIASGFGYYYLLLKESKPVVQITTAQSTVKTTPEEKPGLNLSHVLNAISGAFPIAFNVTSVIENTNGRGIDLLKVIQEVPVGFNITDAYVVGPDGSRLSYKPIATPGRLEYSLTGRLTSKQKMAITVFLQSTATSASGKFTTEVKGAYDGKSIRSQATTWIHVPPPRSTCTDWDTISFGEFRLENNVWGGPTEKHLQCVTYHPDSFGWNVSRLNPQGDLPYYPEVIYGKKPWQMDSTTGSLPVPVTSIKSLEI